MDRILEGYLKAFVQDSNLSHLEASQKFEYFVNYCLVSRIYSEPFDLDNVAVGGGNDTALDGIAVIVNDHLVSTIEEIDFFKKMLRRLDVRFIFIQSKTSDKFDMGDIGNFLFGVESFFDEKPKIKINQRIETFRSLKEHIYDSSVDMESSPICELYYVTTGSWQEDTNLRGRIESGIELLKRKSLFSEVKFIPVDLNYLQKVYRNLKGKIAKQIQFDKHSVLPAIDRVQQAYLGVLPATEYLKLIEDEDGNLQRNLFYDNVRDFQGNNSVNEEIAETLRDTSHSDRFGLLNNGITIVAKSIHQIGSTFNIRDYQIVNGCQTSHILFLNRKIVSERVFVPVKLIVTDDLEVTNLIIKATNRQTEVKVEAFKSLEPFHKKLEEFYGTFRPEKSLYYERRSKQYESLAISSHQIVSIATQAKCFLAMFLNEPHSTHRYYGELLNSNENKLFVETHSLYPYYISGYTFYLLEQFFFAKKLDPSYRRFRFHLLMMFRLLSEESELPYLNSKKIEQYCDKIKGNLWDDSKSKDLFAKGIQIIDIILKRGDISYSGEAERRKSFTNDLIEYISSNVRKGKTVLKAEVNREQGIVKTFSDIRGFGFITNSKGQDFFVHYSDIRIGGYRYLLAKQSVEFTITQNDKGFVAKDVVVIS